MTKPWAVSGATAALWLPSTAQPLLARAADWTDCLSFLSAISILSLNHG